MICLEYDEIQKKDLDTCKTNNKYLVCILCQG